MDNITQVKEKKQESFSEEKKKDLILRFLEKNVGLKKLAGHSITPDENNPKKRLKKDLSSVKKCPFNFPESFVLPTNKEKPIRKKRADPEKKYPELANEARKGFISDITLKKTMGKRLTERPLLYVFHPDGERSLFWGDVKGCDSYNARMQSKIELRSALLKQNYQFFYFLTLTYDIKTWGQDIVEGWKLFNQHLARTMRKLRRKYKIGYVSILESTKKGYPHAHIIMGVPEAIENWHSGLGVNRKVKTGKFHQAIKSSVQSRIFDLKIANPDGLDKYLSKYVAKSVEASTGKLDKKRQKFKGEDRKAILSCILPVLAGIRQFRFSDRDIIHDHQTPQVMTDEEAADLSAAIDLGVTPDRSWESLIKILNKMTGRCRAHVYAVFDIRLKVSFLDGIGWYSEGPPDFEEDFLRAGYSLGCQGCCITQCLDLLMNKPKEKPRNVYLPKPATEYRTPDNRYRVTDLLSVCANMDIGKGKKIDISDCAEFISMGIGFKSGVPTVLRMKEFSVFEPLYTDEDRKKEMDMMKIKIFNLIGRFAELKIDIKKRIDEEGRFWFDTSG